MNSEEYKALSIKEFTKAAEIYDSNHAGIYEMCKDDYPPILEELRRISFSKLLDVGCGTGPMIELLTQEYPDKEYVGVDITPKMIKTANAKHLKNTTFIVGDSEDLPFEANSFDVIICANSFHHYPNPQAFFNEVYRVLMPGGHFVLRDYTAKPWLVWLINHVEMPLANRIGHGDVRSYTMPEIKAFSDQAGLTIETIEARKKFRLHFVAKKPNAA